MGEANQEMQLLSQAAASPSSSHQHPRSPPSDPPPKKSQSTDQFGGPSLDLQLSITVSSPALKPPSDSLMMQMDSDRAEALKWQAAEQIRLAATERACAERVRELTRREMELAQSEFARARSMREKARDEVERAERMKERAAREIDRSSSMEITCQSCSQRFKP